MSLTSRLAKYNKASTDVIEYGYLPCYSNRIIVPEWCDTKEKILDVVEGYIEDSQHGVLMLSLTEEDTYHSLWLETLQETFEEVHIIESKTRHYTGGTPPYKTWFVTIPMHD